MWSHNVPDSGQDKLCFLIFTYLLRNLLFLIANLDFLVRFYEISGLEPISKLYSCLLPDQADSATCGSGAGHCTATCFIPWEFQQIAPHWFIVSLLVRRLMNPLFFSFVFHFWDRFQGFFAIMSAAIHVVSFVELPYAGRLLFIFFK